MLLGKGMLPRVTAPWLLYGANGYTGELIARRAAAAGERPILAGRNREAVSRLATELGLEARVFALDDPADVDQGLAGTRAVLHCAGPFSRTSAPMAEACLRAHVHYLDITGEIEVFEAIWSRAAEIERAGITVVPGAGFDVVPTDCLAAYVASRSDRPTALVLALRGLESASRGTLRTAIRQLSKPVLCRRSGALVALDDRSPRWIDFGAGEEPCVPVSWGDVATAFRSTGVGNVTVYFRRTLLLRAADTLGRLFGPIVRSRIGQRALEAIVRRFPEGPSKAERIRRRTTISAEAIDASGSSFRALLSTPDPYDFTANCALEISSRISSLSAPLGLVTPSQAFGADFVLSLPGCSRVDARSS